MEGYKHRLSAGAWFAAFITFVAAAVSTFVTGAAFVTRPGYSQDSCNECQVDELHVDC
jgi:hypothetical protein